MKRGIEHRRVKERYRCISFILREDPAFYSLYGRGIEIMMTSVHFVMAIMNNILMLIMVPLKYKTTFPCKHVDLDEHKS